MTLKPVLLLVVLGTSRSWAQIPAVCSDRESLEQMTCCPVTEHGMCGEDDGRGECAAVNFGRHRNDTTNVRVNWPHYYTRVCKCSKRFGGYDCSRCDYGYYGSNCTSRAIIPRRPLREFSEEEWRELITIVRMTKVKDSGYVVSMNENTPGTAGIVFRNVSIYNLWVWLHHYAGKDGGDLFSPQYIDYAHIGPSFFTWHRWFSLFLETEIQYMLQAVGREDYYKFRLPYWDWRREIQTSYGLPSEDLFSLNRFGETRNVSHSPVVFGDLVGDWDAICHAQVDICDPDIPTGQIQRCPFIGNPILCHSSNPDWPSLYDVNKLFNVDDYALPPYDFFSVGSLGALVDLPLVNSTIEECQRDAYCTCVPGGATCTGIPANTSIITFNIGVHGRAHFLVGFGGAAPLPPHLYGSMVDFGSAPNDPLFIVHHTMVDCILEEWMRRHPHSVFPSNSEARDGHNQEDFLRPFFPLVSNNDVFVDPRKFGYYCQLSNLDKNTAVEPSPIETRFSVFTTGDSAQVCVETQSAVIVKLVLRDANLKRYVTIVDGPSGCGVFSQLPAGLQQVRAISRQRLPGLKSPRYTSRFFSFNIL